MTNIIERHRHALIATGAVLLIIAVTALIILGVRAHGQRVDHCRDRGGHVTHHTTYTTHYDTHTRKTVTDSDTTYYCLSGTGGVLDVW